ncbi:hypothetical protein APHACPA_1237 [Rickettsia amblyommatis str. Ac/Pa]|uniref:Uncharacterized protein n=1 Tax=Rickettsia amblyommatis str. Ac/Pa TaxID=1359164 RepID=A0A0F3N384_RICAM|nr:hypothetical protein APHACPA_1237 [Rickettsia amblyommatis str. Ac/Pa]
MPFSSKIPSMIIWFCAESLNSASFKSKPEFGQKTLSSLFIA